MITQHRVKDFYEIELPFYENDRKGNACKNYFPRTWGGQTYYGGYMIYSPNHPKRTEEGFTALAQYIPVIQHGLMHVIQTLILGGERFLDTSITPQKT